MEKLDLEYLQKLTYDRSKNWSSFFEVIAVREDFTRDLNITKVDQIFPPEADDDSSDDLASMEEDYDDNVKPEFIKNVSSTSQFSLFMNNATVDLTAAAKTEEEKEYVDVINKTLPIIHEHNRQLHEFGFDKVLISFNKREIENKFGSWLNRHNSLFGGDSTLLYENKNKPFGATKQLATYLKPTRAKPCFNNREEMDDSDASLQSGETARYIRSSRVGSIKNSTTTMIKTYRMVSTREALREKYGCESHEDDYHRYDMRRRKKLANIDYENQYITPLCRSNRNERGAFTSNTHRRKVLRKRINSHSCNIEYSSSDSECYENYRKSQRKNLKFSCNRCNHCLAHFSTSAAVNRTGRILKTCSAVKMSSAHKNRLYYFQRSMSRSSSSASSPYSSFNSVDRKQRHIKRKAKFANDKLPYKRDSECYCYDDEELCKQFNHVAAGTSTEEWHVDSGCSPQKQIKNSITENQRKETKQSCQSAVSQLPVTEKKLLKAKNKSNSKENTCKSKNEQQQESFSGESSDVDLKIAIQKSKESYDKEQKKRQEEILAKKEDKLKSRKPNKRLTKIEEVAASEQTAKKTKIPSQKANSVTKKSKVTRGLTSSVKRSIEETCFVTSEDNKAICNSTALSSQCQAYKRQLSDKQEKDVEDGDGDNTQTSKEITVIDLTDCKPKPKFARKKHALTRISKENCQTESGAASHTVTSTTLRSPELNLSLILSPIGESKQVEQADEKTGDDQSDYAHVTSTTTIEVPTPTETNKETDKMRDDLTRNCVLIYAPENHNMPSVDGYFTVSQDHLSTLIGEKAAKKFLKHYVGRRRFRLDSTVYYKPPNVSYLRLSLSSSSESSDGLDSLGQYGDLFAITK